MSHESAEVPQPGPEDLCLLLREELLRLRELIELRLVENPELHSADVQRSAREGLSDIADRLLDESVRAPFIAACEPAIANLRLLHRFKTTRHRKKIRVRVARRKYIFPPEWVRRTFAFFGGLTGFWYADFLYGSLYFDPVGALIGGTVGYFIGQKLEILVPRRTRPIDMSERDQSSLDFTPHAPVRIEGWRQFEETALAEFHQRIAGEAEPPAQPDAAK